MPVEPAPAAGLNFLAMKKIFFFAIIGLLLGASCCRRPSGDQNSAGETGAQSAETTSGNPDAVSQAPDTGQVKKSEYKPAPDFSLVSIKGDTIRLSDYKGKVVILDFWATWCPPCKEEIPHFKKLFAEKSEGGLMIIGIVVNDDVSEVKKFVSKNAVNYPIVMGNADVEKAYGGINAIPTTFIIGKDMTIRQKVVGYRELSFFKKEVEKLLAE
ncbi:MAG: TlpA disulfide reductase family protein [candidate division WOR-3 bacterium]